MTLLRPIPILTKQRSSPAADPIAMSVTKGLQHLTDGQPPRLSFHFVLGRLGFCFANDNEARKLSCAMFGEYDPYHCDPAFDLGHILPNFLIAAQTVGYRITYETMNRGRPIVNRAGNRFANVDVCCTLEKTEKPARVNSARKIVDRFCSELDFS